jgi:hypothetical protein
LDRLTAFAAPRGFPSKGGGSLNVAPMKWVLLPQDVALYTYVFFISRIFCVNNFDITCKRASPIEKHGTIHAAFFSAALYIKSLKGIIIGANNVRNTTRKSHT